MGAKKLNRHDLIEKYFYTDQLEAHIEDELIHKAQQGCNQSLEKLIIAHLPWMIKFSRRWSKGRKDIHDDALSEVIDGFFDAVKKFEIGSNRLSTYAGFWAHQRMQIFERKYNRIMRLPMNYWADINNENKRIRQNRPFENEKQAYRYYLSKVKDRVPYDIQSSGMAVEDELTPESIYFHRKAKYELMKIVKTLDEKKTYILKRIFGLNGPESPLREIGDELGISHERVRQLRDWCLDKLRFQFKDYSIDWYSISNTPSVSGRLEAPMQNTYSSRRLHYQQSYIHECTCCGEETQSNHWGYYNCGHCEYSSVLNQKCVICGEEILYGQSITCDCFEFDEKYHLLKTKILEALKIKALTEREIRKEVGAYTRSEGIGISYILKEDEVEFNGRVYYHKYEFEGYARDYHERAQKTVYLESKVQLVERQLKSTVDREEKLVLRELLFELEDKMDAVI